MGKLTTIIAAAVIATASTASAQETIITETTTTVVSETNFDALEQAYKTLLLMHGKEMELEGLLYKDTRAVTTEAPQYTLVNDGIKFIVKLDDGRKTTNKAQQCKAHNAYAQKLPSGGGGCKVKMNAEVFTTSYGQIQLAATGWDVEFLKKGE